MSVSQSRSDGDAAIDTILGSDAQRVPLSIGGVVLPKGASFGVELTHRHLIQAWI